MSNYLLGIIFGICVGALAFISIALSNSEKYHTTYTNREECIISEQAACKQVLTAIYVREITSER